MHKKMNNFLNKEMGWPEIAVAYAAVAAIAAYPLLLVTRCDSIDVGSRQETIGFEFPSGETFYAQEPLRIVTCKTGLFTP
jgi:hypothetical protein